MEVVLIDVISFIPFISTGYMGEEKLGEIKWSLGKATYVKP